MRGGIRNRCERESIDRAVARVAAAQHGVFSRAQAIAAGADRYLIYRRISEGTWERRHLSVLQIAGTARTREQEVFAAVLCWGEAATASHVTALALWRLPGGVWGTTELTVPRGRGRTHVCATVIHRSTLPAADVTAIGAIPVTTPTRTLIDIAAVLHRDLVEEALDDALRRRLTSIPRLRWRIDSLARSGRRGIGVIRSLVAERVDGVVPQSVFETRLLRQFRAAGFTDIVRQHPIYDGKRLLAVVDFAFPNARVAIEADGYEWHSGRARWKHDLVRRNALTGLGWKVDRVTWDELDGDGVVERARRLLGR